MHIERVSYVENWTVIIEEFNKQFEKHFSYSECKNKDKNNKNI